MNSVLLNQPMLCNVTANMKDAVCIVDADGTVLCWNKSAEYLYGIAAEDIVGTNVRGKFSFALLPKVIENKCSYEAITDKLKKGCSIVICAAPIFDDNGRLIGGISTERDITEHKRVEELLKNTQKNLVKLRQKFKNDESYSFANIIGRNKMFRKTLRLCEDVSNSDIGILIMGESGTGKELVARAVHTASGRTGSFIAINCSAIPSNLFESELFGYSEGAFTGASKKGKKGKFEIADRGTLFLDEIGDMPMELQAKILRAIESGVICRLGTNQETFVNVRIISATNKSIRSMCEQGLFRWDLYYRLSSAVVELMPLRERKEDIPIFVNYFMEQFCIQYNIEVPYIPKEIMDALIKYEWHGNVRELKNVMERIVILVRRYNLDRVRPDFLPHAISVFSRPPAVGPQEEEMYDLNLILHDAEKSAVIKALRRTDANIARAAELLGIPRTSLYYKIKKLGISIENTVKLK